MRNDNTAFFNDVQRGYRQTAFFTSLDFDLIPKVLTVHRRHALLPLRQYREGRGRRQLRLLRGGSRTVLCAPRPISTGKTSIRPIQGFKSRGNVTWHFLPDALVYYTWSQGFRPGAFNRSNGCYIPDAQGSINTAPRSHMPPTISPITKSAGKPNSSTTACSGTAPSTARTGITCRSPSSIRASSGNVGFGTNGPNYRIHGVETSFVAVLTEGLTAQGGAAWNTSKQTNSPYLVANNPALLANPAEQGRIRAADLQRSTIRTVPAAVRARTRRRCSSTLRLRYQWTMSSYNSFVQAGATHTAHSFTQSSANPTLSSGSNVSTTLLRFENPPISQFDASARRREGCLDGGILRRRI